MGAITPSNITQPAVPKSLRVRKIFLSSKASAQVFRLGAPKCRRPSQATPNALRRLAPIPDGTVSVLQKSARLLLYGGLVPLGYPHSIVAEAVYACIISQIPAKAIAIFCRSPSRKKRLRYSPPRPSKALRDPPAFSPPAGDFPEIAFFSEKKQVFLTACGKKYSYGTVKTVSSGKRLDFPGNQAYPNRMPNIRRERYEEQQPDQRPPGP